MGDARIRLTGEDAASAVVSKVGQSFGTLTGEVLKATKAVDDLKTQLAEAVKAGQQGSIAAISTQLDEAIPKLREAEQALKNELKPAFNQSEESSKAFTSALGGMKTALGALGIGFGVSAVVGFGKSLVDDIGHLNDLHEASGVTTGDLQRLQYVGAGAGLSVDDMAKAVGNLSTRLASGNSGAVAGVQSLGLNIKALLAEGPTAAFTDISEAVGRIEDPMQKNAVAAELFGDKVGRKLIPTLSDMREQLKQVPKEAVIPDDTIQRIAELGDAWDRATLKLKGFLASSIELDGGRNRGAGRNSLDLMYGTERANAEMNARGKDIQLANEGAAASVDLLANRLKELRTQALEPLTDAQKAQIRELKSYGESESNIAKLVDASSGAVHRYVEGVRESEEAQKKLNTEQARTVAMQRNAASSMDTLSGAQVEAIRYYRDQTTSVGDTAKMLGIYEQQVRQVIAADKDADDEFQASAKRMAEASKELKAFNAEWHKLEQLPQNTNYLPKDLFDNVGKAGKEASKALKEIDDNGKRTEETLQRLSSSFAQLAQVTGGTFGGVLKGIGESVAAYQMTNQSVNDYQEASDNKDYGAMAVSGVGMAGGFMAATKGGQGKAKGALSGAAAGAKIGSIAGPWGTAIGAGVGAIVGLVRNMGPSAAEKEGRKVEADFQASFGGFDQMMAKVGEVYQATGHSAQQAQADIKALMDAERQGGDAAKAAIDKINGAFNEQKQDAADLQAAIKQYGFSLEELGPAMQKQKLGEQATTIMNQFRLLAGSGIDVALVEERMSGNINAYLADVIKTGQEVPAAMRPMLEQMAKQGELTDANGNKITDLSAAGVNFAETMTSAADRIVKGFNDVLEKIGLIPAAANAAAAAVPRNPFADWAPPDRFGETPEIPSFANEGFDLTRPMVARVGDARGDSESILHARTVRQIVAAARNAGASALNTRALEAQVEGLRDDFRRLSDAIGLQTTLLPTALRDALVTT